MVGVLPSYFGGIALAVLVALFVGASGRITAEDDLVAGHERVKGLTAHYEVVHIDVRQHSQHVRKRRSAAGEGSSYSHPPNAEFQVQAFGKQYTLKLLLNDVLIPKNAEVQSFDEDDNMMIDSNVVHCYYQGEVDGFGEQSSHAVLSTCNGLSGSFGVGPAGHWTMDQTFFIEPLLSETTTNGTYPHAVFKARDAKWTRGKCGVTPSPNSTASHDSVVHFDQSDISSLLQEESNHHRVRRQSLTTATKYVELMIVMDNTLYRRFNGDMTILANRARSVANFVDSVYRQLNIRIPLVAVQIFNAGDRFQTTSNADTLLSNFLTYRRTQLNPNIAQDNAQLMSGLDFVGNTIGIAPVAEMCSSTRSAGVNQDTRASLDAVASTMAHEMGHNFGMNHDSTTRGCTCSATSAQGGCIMAPSASFVTPRAWSSCSVSDLNTFLSRGSATCLLNVPAQLFGSPVCGNGFVEGMEQCDCGTVSECQDQCCDAATCRLTAGSQCAAGDCCQSCRYRAAGTVCRSAMNGCDVAETCSGTTHTCPNNIFRQNGQSCRSGTLSSYCWNGACNTHDAQCKRTWTATASVAPQRCYDQNIQGTEAGNCGIDSSNLYIRCTTVNTGCGRLQCVGGSRFTVLSTSSTTHTITIGSIVCKSTTITANADTTDPGYVDDGTICGTGSLCVNRQCRAVTALGITPCPARGGIACSGNGICTNLNTCLCNKGYTASDCSRSTSGPINGQWSPWTTWTGCSQTCGDSGVRSRMRDCDNPPPSNGGVTCSGASSSRETCNRVVCSPPVNGMWSSWATWTGCSKSCYRGQRARLRSCTSPPPSNGGSTCSGSGTQSEYCNTQACPSWQEWGLFGPCTRTCGGGQRTRIRTCSVANQCATGSNTNTTACTTTVPCSSNAVDGGWSTWTSWGACSVTCDTGMRSRTRQCNQPTPENGGAGCVPDGSKTETDTKTCTPTFCSDWAPWGSFSACTATCGGGDQLRIRECPVSGRCVGPTMDKQPCGTVDCDMSGNGEWTQWTAWSGFGNCSFCQEGSHRVRTRNCTNPPPMGLNGEKCPGPFEEEAPCVCNDAGSQNAGGLSGGGVAGIVIGLLAIAAVVVGVVLYLKRNGSLSGVGYKNGTVNTARADSQQPQGRYVLAASDDKPVHVVSAGGARVPPKPRPPPPGLPPARPFAANEKAPSRENLLSDDDMDSGSSVARPARPAPPAPAPKKPSPSMVNRPVPSAPPATAPYGGRSPPAAPKPFKAQKPLLPSAVKATNGMDYTPPTVPSAPVKESLKPLPKPKPGASTSPDTPPKAGKPLMPPNYKQAMGMPKVAMKPPVARRP